MASASDARPRLDRILVATDFSELSGRAAAYARMLAEAHGSELHVVNVVSPPVATGSASLGGGIEPLPSVVATDALIEGGRGGLERFVEAHLGGLAVTCEVLIGPVHHQICDYAQRQGCDLIVIGSHAQGMVRRMLLGSTSKAVLEHAPCPVFMVPLRCTGCGEADTAGAPA